MILYHPNRYKVSFAALQNQADISINFRIQELKMSVFTHESMIDHHGYGFFARVADTLHAWHERYVMRRELSHWSERELHDVGLSAADVAYEVDKPFWRA